MFQRGRPIAKLYRSLGLSQERSQGAGVLRKAGGQREHMGQPLMGIQRRAHVRMPGHRQFGMAAGRIRAQPDGQAGGCLAQGLLRRHGREEAPDILYLQPGLGGRKRPDRPLCG